VDGGPGSGRYPKGSGKLGKLSATGANPDVPGFTVKGLSKHWGEIRDHSNQYKELDKEGYANRAAELARKPIGGDINGYKASDGAIVRYDKKNNDFVKAHDTGVDTMFKPAGGESYFDRAMKRDGGTQND
jgi:hypothetical protein